MSSFRSSFVESVSQPGTMLAIDWELMLLNVIEVKFQHRNTHCKVWSFILRVWTVCYGNLFDHKFKMATRMAIYTWFYSYEYINVETKSHEKWFH
jgi:hypothetical protein